MPACAARQGGLDLQQDSDEFYDRIFAAPVFYDEPPAKQPRVVVCTPRNVQRLQFCRALALIWRDFTVPVSLLCPLTERLGSGAGPFQSLFVHVL